MPEAPDTRLSSVSTQPSIEQSLRVWLDAHAHHFHRPTAIDLTNEIERRLGPQHNRRHKKRRMLWMMACSAMVLTGAGMAVAIVVGRTVAGTSTSETIISPVHVTTATHMPLPTTTGTLSVAEAGHHGARLATVSMSPTPLTSSTKGDDIMQNVTGLSFDQDVGSVMPVTSSAQSSGDEMDEKDHSDENDDPDVEDDQDVEVDEEDEDGDADYMMVAGRMMILQGGEASGGGICPLEDGGTTFTDQGTFNGTTLMHHVNVMRDALGLPRVRWSEAETFAVQDWVATANTSCLSTASPMEPPPINFLLLDETTFANASFRYPIKEWYLAGNSHWNYTSNACVDGMYDVDCYRLRYLVGSSAMGCDVSCACPGEDPKLRRLWCSFDLPEGFADNSTIPAPINLKTMDLTLLEANDLGPAASGQSDDNSIRFPSDS